MALNLGNNKKASWIILGIAIFEGSFVSVALVRDPSGILRIFGFAPGARHATPLGWCLAAVTAFCFAFYTGRLAAVRETMFRLDSLKAAALLMAVAAGVLEEWSCRMMLMNSLRHHGLPLWFQIVISACAFGLLHATWAFFRGSWGAGLRAAGATSVLGGALAIVYVVSSRVLAPCICAHIVIDALSEPGLVLAALRGEMGEQRPRPEKR